MPGFSKSIKGVGEKTSLLVGWDILVRTGIFSQGGETFFKTKNDILYILNINKTKIRVSCVHKQYEVKMKMVQKQRLQLKMNFLSGYNMIIVILLGKGGGRTKICWLAFFLVEGNKQTFSQCGDSTPFPSRENPVCYNNLVLQLRVSTFKTNNLQLI